MISPSLGSAPGGSVEGISFGLAAPGLLHNFSDNRHPTEVHGFAQGKLGLAAGATHFGFVYQGAVTLKTRDGDYTVRAGQYFAIPGQLEVLGDVTATGFIATRLGYTGLFVIGGRIEEKGRLPYIDGCSDSVIVAPPVLGDPCMNMLFIPPGVNQTPHTHPSLRIGMIVEGRGVCKTTAGDIVMLPGMVFVLGVDRIHSFHTDDSHMRIVVYHPDSDTGPSATDHPMLNRSYVDGVSAAEIGAIQTKGIL